MKPGDIVEIDGSKKGVVLATSNYEYLDYQLLGSTGDKDKFYIGVSPIGNPRVRVVKRTGKGKTLPTVEWSRS